MLEKYLDAGYPAFWITTSENKRAIKDLATTVGDGRKVAIWNCVEGLSFEKTYQNDMLDPEAPIKWLFEAPNDTILFLENYHAYINGMNIIQIIINGVEVWKEKGKAIVIIAPSQDIPIEVNKIFRLMEFALPTNEQLKDIMHGVCEDAKVKSPKDADSVVNSALGLAAAEAENAFALSLATKGKFDIPLILEQKAQIVKKNATLTFGVYKERFEHIGGLENLKEFCLKTVKNPLSKGVLLLGVPGTGKSMFAKALGNEANLPILFLDMGKVFGSKLGESEQRIRDALQIAERMAPVVLFIDELEKGISGANSSAQTDGGVGNRVFGTFLTWLNDRPEGIYVIATCNDIQQIASVSSGAFLRAERWDAIFFVDLPNELERSVILEIYRKKFKIKESIEDHKIKDWTGAEICTLCRMATMLDITLPEAMKFVVPVARSMTNDIKALRDWATTRTVPASMALENGPGGRRIRVGGGEDK